MERNFSTQVLSATALTYVTLLFYVYHGNYAENVGTYLETSWVVIFHIHYIQRVFFCTKSKSFLNVLLPTTLN